MSISERRAQRLQNRQRKMRPSPPPRRRGASPSPTPPLRSVGTAPAATVSSTNRRTAIMNMPHPDISSRSLNPQNSNRTLDNNNTAENNNSNTNTNSDQQIAQLNAQLIQHQEQTIHALQELSQTIKHLMVTQIKRDKDSEDDTKDMLNVDRATVRLDGLEVYAVVSALTVATAIACFDSYGTDLTTIFTPSQLNRHNALPLFLNTVFLAVSGIGIIAGLHATLVFSLMTMYGRTAVGVSHDEAFVEFFVQTGRVRYRGFHTFRMSLYCFLIQVLFTITSKSSPILRPFVIIVNLACIYWVYVDTQSVIDKAGDILFNFNAQQQRRTSDAGNLSLQRTLSDMSGNAGANRSPSRQQHNESSGESDLDVSTSMKHQQQKEQPVPKASGGGASTLQNMRQRARARPSAKAAATVNGRYSRKKGVARSKSGVLVYDVGPRDARPVRRGGRRPSRNN
ncbi:expressed unknown protein [Seminavis robusta]|uniref:Uncharacterized protein n=1 Tax=Seminavis robusta TaxID=568900 RepID=A0A9N8E7W2_9STRA|nr:expressed unknown protein [Seminavis robusta]|eukprot:Sro640_g179900.1 n/a (453) ;mRNA; r:41138-42496